LQFPEQFLTIHRGALLYSSCPSARRHRQIPDELYEPGRLKFWWGLMPGHTAYPWVFPNDGNVARVGLTMPIGLDIDDYDPEIWELLRRDDERIPQGAQYIERLLEREYPEYDLDDFPLAEDRGKRGGTETYAISSTRPIESPTKAGIAVVGGAMGGTSAFHEGGDHVAVRTGKIAGRLAAEGRLERYNNEWQDALETEILRNVTMADLVHDYTPSDWDRAFGAADRMFNRGQYTIRSTLRAGLTGLKMLYGYKRTKRQFKNGGYVQFSESEYDV
jgi:electron-transferring-flavoprotein dehydrogenase